MPLNLAIRTLNQIDNGFNWLTNQVLQGQPNPANIDYIILKTYFQIFLLLAITLFCARILTSCLAHPHHTHGRPSYSPLSTLSADDPPSSFADKNVDVYLDLPPPTLAQPLDQLLHLLRSLVHDHRHALGLWHRTPSLQFHFYHQPLPQSTPDRDSEKSQELSSSSSLHPFPPSSQPSSFPPDCFVAVKPLLTDLLDAATHTDVHRILLISTDDRDLVQYGIQLLQLLPDPPLICYVIPLGTQLPLQLTRAADLVFGWAGHQFELIPKTYNPPQEDDQPWETEAGLKIFRPLVLLLRAHGPVGLARLCVSQLEGLLNPPHSGSHILSGYTFPQYIRLALSLGVVGMSPTSGGAATADLLDDLDGSTLIYLQRWSKSLVQQTSECSSESATAQEISPFSHPPPPLVADSFFHPAHSIVDSYQKGDHELRTSSESERVTNSHRSSFGQLPLHSEPRSTLKHAPSDPHLEPLNTKKRRQPTATRRPSRHTATFVHRRRRPRAKLLAEPGSMSPSDSLNNIALSVINSQPASTPQPSSNHKSLPIEQSPVPVYATTPITPCLLLPSPASQTKSSDSSPVRVYATITSIASPTTERRSFDLERGSLSAPYTPSGHWIRSWSRASGLIQRHEPLSPLQEILRPKTFSPLQDILKSKSYFISSTPGSSRGLDIDPFSVELGGSLLDAKEDLEMEID